MFNGELDETEWSEVWHAPEGNDYTVQYRRSGEKAWFITAFALSKATAIEWFNNATSSPMEGCEYRIVKLSRYPPCSVAAVIKYFRG